MKRLIIDILITGFFYGYMFQLIIALDKLEWYEMTVLILILIIPYLLGFFVSKDLDKIKKRKVKNEVAN